VGTTERHPDTAIEKRLEQEFYRFSFFKAVTLLESLSDGKKGLGKALVPDDEAVRFTANRSLSFPASEISALELKQDSEPTIIEVAFLGLIGPMGVLPYWYTELVNDRIRQKDTGLKDFLDMFQHRLVSLFYLAWKKHRFTANYQPGAKDRISQYLLGLIGLGSPGLADRIGVPEEALIFYSGHFSRAVSSAVSIQGAVEHFSGVHTRLEQFIERSLALEAEDQTQIGSLNSELGVTTIVGSETKECQTKFRVNMGPMPFSEFEKFLPTGQLLRSIFALVKYMVGIEYEFEIRLILAREEIPGVALGGDTALLGWSSWVKATEYSSPVDPAVTFQELDLPDHL
jgi:type VI secretion system protein ImpH